MRPSRVKTREDTWKADELTRHLKAVDSERLPEEKNTKEKKHRRDYDRSEVVERGRKHSEKEQREEREQYKYVERDIHAGKEREAEREHRREKERTRERARERKTDREKYDSDRVREKETERKHIGEDYGEGDQIRKEKERRRREMRDIQDKSRPHRNDDRERRHRERREKDEKIQEIEDKEDKEQRHRKHRETRENLNSHDEERERRRSDRKYGDDAERERRHRRASERPTQDNTEQHVKRESQEQKLREREKGIQEGDMEQKHRKKPRERDESGGKPTERRKADKEAHSFHQESSRSVIKRKTALEDMELEKDDTSDPALHAEVAYDDSTNYEEDFEDYDDDFEDESDLENKEPIKSQKPKLDFKNPHLEDIQKAMTLENEMIASFPSKEKPNTKDLQDSVNKGAHRGTFIDFGTAKQKLVNRQVANKLKKRSADLLRLIDLDFSCTVLLLDLAPVKEYDMYIWNFGKTNTKQAYVQCNEDCVDREIQTEEIDFEEKWTQHPAESSVVCGGDKNNAVLNDESIPKPDAQRLTCFLRSACQVIAVLLEEDRADRTSEWKLQSKEFCMSISDGCFQINTTIPFLQDRRVLGLQFSETQRYLLLSLHGSCNQNRSVFPSDKFVICVWNIWEPSSPQHVLFCESEVGCCCFGPGKVPLVFAGTADGSVLLWDLREDASMHRRITLTDKLWTFRFSTFCTDGVFAKVNHSSPVKAIEPVLSAAHKEHRLASFTAQEDVLDLSFQIATLDETGRLILWVVVELRKDDIAGSQNDLGLIPGGKVKLVHSSSVFLNGSFFPKDILSSGTPQTLNIKFLPQDSNHFFIGTDIGLVTHGTRYGLIEPPRHYKPQHSKIGPSQVTAVDFSPFQVPVFLAGCSDGCIRLHRTSAQFPVMQWNDSTNGQPVVTLCWSLTRPSIFFVLDAAGFIYIWDLLENDLQPVAKESSLSDQIISMAVLGEPEKNNGLTGLALAKSSGKVEIQYIKKKLAKPQPKEQDRLSLLLL